MEMLLGVAFFAAIPVGLVTAVLLPIATHYGRSHMWVVTALLATVPVAWAVSARSKALIIGGTVISGRGDLRPSMAFLVMLPLLAVAGALHFANKHEWSSLWAGVFATGAGVLAFFFALTGAVTPM